MDNVEFALDAAESMFSGKFNFNDEIPEPIDQWSVEDFEQFAYLVADTE